jgi:hypothetical protein
MVLLASDFDKSKYLKAEDLKAEKKFRIKAVTVEEVGEKKEQKLVVWFTNDERGLVLNKTNNRTIRNAFGDDTKAWEKMIIAVFPTMVDMRGKLTPGLRVRIPPPKQAAAAAPAPKPATPSGNGVGTAAVKPLPAQQTAATAPVDPELEDEPPKSLAEDLDDEIPFESRTADR